MAINSLSPAFIRVFYTRAAIEHVMTIPTKFASTPIPGTNPSLLTHSGGSTLFAGTMNDVGDLFAALCGSTTTFNTAEVWSQPTPADDPVWIYTATMDVEGTNAVASVPAEQLVMTFRSDLGGLYRLYVMEASVPPNTVVVRGAFGTAEANLADYITGSTSMVYARDNGKPIIALQYKTKTNDVLRRRLLTG